MTLTPAQMTDDWLMLRQLSPEARHRLLLVHFADLLLKRPTELQALLNLYYAAERASNPPRDWWGHERTLTARQRQCLSLRAEAIRRGLPRHQWARFIAEQLCIQPQVVRKVLHRADDLLEARSDERPGLPTPVEERPYRLSAVEQARITAYMMTHRRECAHAGRGESLVILRDGTEKTVPRCQGWTLGNRALCYPCFQIWGVYGDHWPAWLVYSEREIRLRFRREAIEALRIADDDLDALSAYGEALPRFAY